MFFIRYENSNHSKRKLYQLHCNNIAMVMYMTSKRTYEKPMSISMEGYEVVEKTAKQCSTSARVLVPKSWIGKQVRVVRLEP